MQYLFHGDDYGTSRMEFNQHLDNCQKTEILRIDNKQIDLDKINNFINGASLFGDQKILAISNFFSISKPILDKLIPMISQSAIDIVIWQDKVLTQVQLKTFPKATVFSSKLNNTLFQCLNTIKPNNLKNFLTSYEKVDKASMYDLFLYLLKNNLRKQLIGPSSFNPRILKTTYLQLIELDYQNKSGQLTIPKEIALVRIIINLIKN
ncbi:MAG: hypothetical protein WC841_02135 [Candidatus Shapirobacteria bacterium]